MMNKKTIEFMQELCHILTKSVIENDKKTGFLSAMVFVFYFSYAIKALEYCDKMGVSFVDEKET